MPFLKTGSVEVTLKTSGNIPTHASIEHKGHCMSYMASTAYYNKMTFMTCTYLDFGNNPFSDAPSDVTWDKSEKCSNLHFWVRDHKLMLRSTIFLLFVLSTLVVFSYNLT